MIITARTLRKHHACKSKVALFAAAFPDGMPVTRENIHKAMKAALDVEWGLCLLPARAAYREATIHAEAAYREATAEAIYRAAEMAGMAEP